MKYALSRRARWILAVAAALVVVYAIAGFFVAPGIVRDRLARQIGATLHRPATVGRVRVNPFALSVTVDTLRVADRDGALLLAWDELYVNAEILSLARRELDLAEVRLVNPYGRMVIRRDGTLNVSDIVDSLKASPSSGPAPVVAIDGLHIAGARFDVVDSATPRSFHTTIGPWRIDLAAFATRRDNNSRYSFSGRTESGESFAWAGTLAIDPLRSAGEFSLDSVKLYKYGPFYERTVGFDVARGVASAKAAYELNLAPQGRVMRLTGGELALGDLLVLERGHQDTAYAVPSLRLTGLDVDAETRRATVGAITAHRITVRASRSRDSTINLIRLIGGRDSSAAAGAAAPGSAARGPAAAKPAAAKAAPAAPAPWRWLIARLAADSAVVSFVDSVPARAARLVLTNVSASIDSIASDSNAQSRVRASLSWEPRGTLTADGTVKIWRRTGELAVRASDVSLRPLDSYGAPAMNLLVSDGRLNANGRVRFEMADSLHPDVGFRGDVRVDRLATVDGKDHQPFLSFASLRFTSIDYAMRAKTLAMQEIRLDDPLVTLRVAPDGTTSMSTVFPLSAADSARLASKAVADSGASHAAPGAPPRDSAAASQTRTSIGSVRITNGSVRLDDRSLQPAVVFSVEKIDALTGRLSTDSLGRGTLDLAASIDGVAPVKVTGRFNPLSAKEGSDLTVDLQGMEMVPLGPYSGKFLGYLIEKGKMKVDMKYKVVGRQLESENKLTLDQFTFGDKTDSPDATKMPVKLGFAVLRDRSGQIVFDVPIEGNLDDPDFKFGRVIGRAILNVLTRIVTSPFSLLGGMFGGGDADLSFVQFTPGSATLAPAETKKLDVLAKSLYARPSLKLEIAGGVDTVADAAALRAAKLEARLRTLKWTALRAKDPNAPPVDSVAITRLERPSWVTAAFVGAFPADSAVVAANAAKTAAAAKPGKPAKGAKAATDSASTAPPYPVAEMERRLLATIVVSPDDLRLLATARAKKCLDYLLTVPAEKIEPGRVFLTEGAMKVEGARAAFTLQ